MIVWDCLITVESKLTWLLYIIHTRNTPGTSLSLNLTLVEKKHKHTVLFLVHGS